MTSPEPPPETDAVEPVPLATEDEPPPVKVSASAPGWVLMLGGVVAIVGSLTPWATVNFADETVNGTAGDGRVTIVSAVVVVLCGVTIALRQGRLWSSVVGLVFALLTVAVAAYDLGSINGTYGPLSDVNIPRDAVSVGFGLWLTLAGAAVTVLAALATFVRRRSLT